MKKICVVLLFVAASTFGQTFPAMTQLPTGAPALASSSSTNFTFVVAGDNRPAKDGDPLTTPLLDIIKQLAATPPAFVVWGGDTVFGKQDIGIDAQYAQFLAAFKPVPVPVFNAPGNHEMVVQTMVACGTASDPYNGELPDFSGSMMASYQKDMAPLYGMFRYGNAAFLIMNTDDVLDVTLANACDYNGYVGKTQLAALQDGAHHTQERCDGDACLLLHASSDQGQRRLADRCVEERYVAVRDAGAGVSEDAR